MAPPMSVSHLNEAFPGLPYFAPLHAHPPGAPLKLTSDTATIFTPLRIRSATLKNRIIVSPMCQFSCAASGPQIGCLTDYHIATLGHYALKGAALVFIEATAVQPNGRITPNCAGLWCDAQIEGVKRVADFVHSQGALCGIQLAHAGRKSSTLTPWVAARRGKTSMTVTEEDGGWPEDVVGPVEGDCWDGGEGGFYPPRELTQVELRQMVEDWKSAAVRAVHAGVDAIEIHVAHGYLLHQFLSPITNRRNDGYGGSFDSRTRLIREIVEGVRSVIPDSMPLFLRVSSTEWMEDTEIGKELGSWDVESTIQLAKLLPAWGVDLLDPSSGGNHPQQRVQAFTTQSDYQVHISGRVRQEMIKAAIPLLIGAVGLITKAEQAKEIVQMSKPQINGHGKGTDDTQEFNEQQPTHKPMADVIFVARQFMREPDWVMRVAQSLGIDVAWPSQFSRTRL